MLVNGHGGNYVLGNVVQEAEGDMALFPSLEDWDAARDAAGIETPAVSDMHAGELETSILLHARPELVRDGYAGADHLADDRRHLLTVGMAPYTESGVVGRPSLASAGKGKDVLASLLGGFGGCLAVLQQERRGAGETRDEGEYPVHDGDGQSLGGAEPGGAER